MSKKTVGGILLAFVGAAGFYGLGLKQGFEWEHTPRCPDDLGSGSAHVAALSDDQGVSNACVAGKGITVKVEVVNPNDPQAPQVAKDVLRNIQQTIDLSLASAAPAGP